MNFRYTFLNREINREDDGKEKKKKNIYSRVTKSRKRVTKPRQSPLNVDDDDDRLPMVSGCLLTIECVQPIV